MNSMGTRSLGVDVELLVKEMVWCSTRDERAVGDMSYLCFGTMEKMIEELSCTLCECIPRVQREV
jgi:hypothetical protein